MTCLIDILTENTPQIALFTETKLNDMTNLKIQGYSFCGKGRMLNESGGVGILVRNDIMDHVTPHETKRDLELIWVSVRRANQCPLYIGVYYGKQETRTRKEDVENEFGDLTEEILELKRNGDVIIVMDANAKVGILGEDVSRNGKYLLDMTNEVPLENMNLSEKCKGQVTRVNRKNPSERSAIDFVLACPQAENLIEGVEIDEDGKYLMRSEKAASDHNSILISLHFQNIDHHKTAPVPKWEINASEDQRDAFVNELGKFEKKSRLIMSDTARSMDERYSEWFGELTKILSLTIGKRTIKSVKPEKFSEEVQKLRGEKRSLKKAISQETEIQKKEILKADYFVKQRETREQIKQERNEKIQEKFEIMINDKSCKTFWKLIKDGNREPPSTWISVKDKDGKRLIDPRDIKERVANYYEDLFKKPDTEHHPYHEIVLVSIEQYDMDRNFEDLEYNECPTLAEVKNAIRKKKNGKSTTDLPNELLKYGEDEMAKIIHHVIKAFWSEEKIISLWNEGLITSLWKGKGDKEMMDFQRGITVSSSIAMIPEEIIHNRMRSIMDLTQAQGGGKKGCATRDHIFIVRAVISAALKQKRELFLTFYDVEKAYDHADPQDMLYVAWNAGLKGKLWRLTKLLNTDLTARINTRYGKTRQITREVGGKQGGKIMTFLFAKLIDTLAEDLQSEVELGIDICGLILSVLEWVDDVISFAENYEQQIKTLDFINEFAIKHKLSWGAGKCKVMQIGVTNNMNTKWKLGDKEITSTDRYTYLGDIITADGKNTENLENRKEKLQRATRRVLADSRIDVIQNLGVKTVLKLHEAKTIPAILNNCDTWILTKTDRNKLDKMEVWAYKKLLNLPITTPTAAVIFESRSLFTSVRVINKQLKYLHEILSRNDADQCKKSLFYLESNCMGWGIYIRKILQECELSMTFEEITAKRKNEWNQIVDHATWEMNSRLLLELCKNKGKMRTKTLRLSEYIANGSYKYEGPPNVLFDFPRKTVKLILMARYGMLDCANNYHGKYGTKMCKECNVVDDENHRLNFCGKWRHVNLYGKGMMIDFETVYSEDKDVLRQVSTLLESVWNVENGKNEMHI